MNVVEWFLVILIVVAGIVFIGWVTVEAQKEEAFSNVCHFVGGNVEGDVCIKDGKVVMTKKEYEEAND